MALNEGGPPIRFVLTHTGDMPIQVGSQCHFAEVNGGLGLDRILAYGMRRDIAAGGAVRFERGQSRGFDGWLSADCRVWQGWQPEYSGWSGAVHQPFDQPDCPHFSVPNRRGS